MVPTAHPTAEDRQWRRRRKGSRTGGSLHGLRLCDLETLLRYRWGTQLPDDDAGRDDALIILHHMVNHATDPRGRMAQWLATRCPWMHATEAAAMIARVVGNPKRWRADTLAKKLHLTAADRTQLRITTIGAIDLLKEQRIARRRQRDRDRKRRNRREAGAPPRAEYLATIKARAKKPWMEAGISRASWYRRQKGRSVRRGSATAHPLNTLAD